MGSEMCIRDRDKESVCYDTYNEHSVKLVASCVAYVVHLVVQLIRKKVF